MVNHGDSWLMMVNRIAVTMVYPPVWLLMAINDVFFAGDFHGDEWNYPPVLNHCWEIAELNAGF